MVLEDEGLTVLTSETLTETREHLKTTIPNVVVLDIMLPDGDGLDFLSELREQCAAPVLFLTARRLDNDTVAKLRAGGDGYMEKPYSLDEFRLCIERFLCPASRKGTVNA